MRKHKAQVAVEVMILVSFILLFFGAFFLLIRYNMEDEIYLNYNQALKDTSLFVQNELNLAYKASEGYSRVFEMPSNIRGLVYNASLVSGMVYLKSENGKYATSLPVPAVQGVLKIGENIIKKVNGTVYLNE